MRRRRDESEPPPELLRFDGLARGITRYADWLAALEQWTEARRDWAARHGCAEADMPGDVGPAPWDFEAMIGPVDPATHEVVRRDRDGTPAHVRRRDV